MRLLLLLLANTVALGAQIYAPMSVYPQSRELNSRMNYPFMRGNSRVQFCYDRSEVGSQLLWLRRMSFRYDGPTSASAANYYAIHLLVRVGVTDRSVEQMGSVFDLNLTQPLSTLTYANFFNFATDSQAVPGPEAFGAQNNQFALLADAPIPLLIPNQGALVVDLAIAGNSNNFLADTMLDAHQDLDGLWVAGSSQSIGRGCPAPPNGVMNATVIASGDLIPGASISVHGFGYPSFGPVFTYLALLPVVPPIVLPRTDPPCTLWLDPMTSLLALQQVADAGGVVHAYSNDSFLAIPKLPQLNQLTFLVQNLAVGTAGPNNPYGVHSSDARRITLGSFSVPTSRIWFAAHHLNPFASQASSVGWVAAALRID